MFHVMCIHTNVMTVKFISVELIMELSLPDIIYVSMYMYINH